LGIRILYIGEIVGKAGIWCVKNALPVLKQSEKPDLVIANGDGTTGSFGLGRQHAGYLRKMGIDVITGGECIFYKKDLVEGFDSIPYVIRPANFPSESPGRGWRFAQVGNQRVAIVSLLGRVGFNRVHSENPFTALPLLADRLHQETPYVIVDFHAGATAEKQAFFFHADGKVSAVIGSHGRVQTSDETILPNGCGVITDAGRTGSMDSVGGVDPQLKIREYVTRIPDWSRDAWAKPSLQGVVIDLDKSGKTSAIRRIMMDCDEPPQAEAEKGD
jgi:2',3'-cyclic-nucleotide 2'-phosphodiesterase